jgi:hypothetical protein
MTDTVSPVLEALLAKAEQDSIDCERPYGRVVYSAGNTVAWDNCCGSSDEGGQLWVRLISLLPLPQGGQSTVQQCGVEGVQVRAALGGVRCQHCLKDDDNEDYAPTVAEMLEDARAQGSDAFRLLQSIRTITDVEADGLEWPTWVNWKSWKIEQGLPLGPEGCCGGFEWTFSFNLLLCAGC